MVVAVRINKVEGIQQSQSLFQKSGGEVWKKPETCEHALVDKDSTNLASGGVNNFHYIMTW